MTPEQIFDKTYKQCGTGASIREVCITAIKLHETEKIAQLTKEVETLKTIIKSFVEIL
jgi:hypothetical protein